MATYRKKPVNVDAFRWSSEPISDWPAWLQNAFHDHKVWQNGSALSVETNEGPVRCNRGDWLIQAADGRIWPTDDAYFRENYEEV